VVYDPANLDLYVVESLALHAEDLRNWDPIQGYWIAVVSTVTNRIVATYSTAFPVMGEAYDSDNGYLYVSDFLNSSVCLLDPSDGAIVAQVEIGVQAFDLTYDSANGYVYAIAGTVGNHFEDDNAQIAISAGLGYSAPTSATDVVAVIDGVTVIGPDIPTGGGPSRGVFDSGNQQVYIVNSATGNLTVIDGAPAGATFGGITTGSSADALAFDPTNGEIYEADVSSNCITAVSSGSGAVVDSCIGVGSGPDAIAYDPSNGFLYVANGNSNDLTVIDGSTNLVVTSSIATGTAPSSIVYDSENGYIYVANSGDGTLTVVSTASSVAVATINLDDWPAALAFDSSNGYVYATEPSNDAVAVVDGALNTQVGDIWMNNGCCGGHFYRIPNQPTGITYDPLNGELYVTDYGTGLVAILNTTTNSDTVDLEVGYLPLGITFDPNNGYLYVANEGSGDVSVINGSADSVPVPDLGISFGGSFTLVYDSIHGYLVAGSGSTLVGLDVN
jgi:YVTN family beta-propeller protein